VTLCSAVSRIQLWISRDWVSQELARLNQCTGKPELFIYYIQHTDFFVNMDIF
jgi:hypothetical protein